MWPTRRRSRLRYKHGMSSYSGTREFVYERTSDDIRRYSEELRNGRIESEAASKEVRQNVRSNRMFKSHTR